MICTHLDDYRHQCDSCWARLFVQLPHLARERALASWEHSRGPEATRRVAAMMIEHREWERDGITSA